MDPLVIVFGFGVGILIGMTGIGGGSLMTPLLILFAGIHPTVAIGTDLAYRAITKTLGGWRHLRKGTVDLGVSKWLAFGSVPGSILGVLLLDWALKSRPDTLLVGVGAALFVVALSILFRALFLRAAIERERHTVVLTTGTKVAVVLRPTLGCVLLGSALGVFSKAGMDLPTWTIVGVPVLVGLAAALLHRLRARRAPSRPTPEAAPA
jgi:uncharacterized protein